MNTTIFTNYIMTMLFKRIGDLIFVFVAIFILIIPFIAVWITLTLHNNGAGAFFTQERPGLHGKIFKLIKFKTMTDKTDSDGNLLPDSQRLTKIGQFIRSTSLDELPQLWNVVKGEMSLVGPRPLLVQYLPLYSPEQARRHLVKPGITGWAQVNGRNAITWKQKFEYDVWYVDNLSLMLDLKIMWLTMKKVISRDGINSATSATTELFNGNN